MVTLLTEYCGFEAWDVIGSGLVKGGCLCREVFVVVFLVVVCMFIDCRFL